MTTFINDSNLALVRDNMLFISKHLTTAPKAKLLSDIKAAVSKIHNIILQNNNPLERFYFIHLLCKLSSDEKANKVERILKSVIPSPPSTQSMGLVSDIISFALCHSSSNIVILDQLTSHLNSCDIIKIDIESWHQATSLALDSPTFCSALLSQPDLNQMGISKKLLAKWLQDLSKTEQKFPAVNISHIIRHSLIGQRKQCETLEQTKEKSGTCQEDSDLHFCVLTLMQSRRCLTITNQFLIEIAKLLAEQTSYIDSPERTMVLDRFGQILSVAAACKVTTITNSLRNALKCLDSNQLIAGLITWQNE